MKVLNKLRNTSLLKMSLDLASKSAIDFFGMVCSILLKYLPADSPSSRSGSAKFSLLRAKEFVCDDIPPAGPYLGDHGSEPCRSREVRLLRPPILFLPTDAEAVELRPDGIAPFRLSSSTRLFIEADVRDLSRIRMIGEVGAEVVESVRNRPDLVAARLVDMEGKAT